MNKQTLEEAAREYWRRGQFGLEKAADTETAFLKGAQWQQERMYNSKEDLREAAAIGKFAEKKYLERLNNFQSIDFKDGVFEGAKWQQERMYSEEEVFKIIASLLHTPKLVEESSWEDIAKWFEQFKKK